MALAQLPHFLFDPSKPVHQPLKGDAADPTQAATSLQSGTFQYVNSDFLRKASSVLSNISASTIDPSSGWTYLLRRVDLKVHPDQANLVVLDAGGNIIHKKRDPGMTAGHSIKLIDGGKGAQPWVVDKGSSTIRIYDTGGEYLDSIGPDIEGSTTKAQGGIGIPEKGPSVVLGKITDIAFDAKVGQFYITDGDVGGPYNRVVVLDTMRRCLAVWGASSLDANSIQIKVPHAVAVDSWSRVWIVDSHNSRVQVVDRTGNVLNKWTFPGLTLYGISISTARAADKTAMVYLTGNTSDLGSDTGTIMLLTTTYDPKKPSDIGSNTPMTAWNNQPGTMLHWICSGPIMDQEMILLSNLTNNGKSDDNRPAASAYQLAVPRPLFQASLLLPAGPLWPTSFHAVTLLHPFEKDNEPLCVAEIWYTELTFMQFDIYTMTGIKVSFKYKLVDDSTVYYFSINGSPYYGPFPTTKIIPAHDWIAKRTTFQGQLPILNVQTNWWYQVVQPGHMTMWHWFRDDTNVPWRTMNSIKTNPNNLPLLEDFAFINWPTFNSIEPSHQMETPAESHEFPDFASLTALKHDISVAQVLAKLVQADEYGRLPITPAQRQANLDKLKDLVPGLSPGSGGLPLPVWPSEFFMTCTMTAVNAPNPMSTEVLYNWSTKLQRTRMFHFDQASAVDAVLTTDPSPAPADHLPDDHGHAPGTTYLIERYLDGTFKCGPPIPNIGPPYPNWAAKAKAQIVATIKNNPQLSPGATTRIFHCPYDIESQSQFWIWYSDKYASDTPIVFMQTLPPAGEGTNLALADYQRMQTTPLIDTVSFSVPNSCKH